MIEDMESELTEFSEINSKTNNLEVTEEVDVDEEISIGDRLIPKNATK